MKLDRTHIPIRPRAYDELLDLSLHLFVRHAGMLARLAAVFLLPWILLDLLIVVAPWGDPDMDRMVRASRAMIVLPQLVYLQAPLATSAMTVYLGRAMFDRPVGVATTWNELKSTAGQLIVVLGFFRMGLIGTGIAVLAIVDRSTDDGARWLGVLGLITLVALVVRGLRPFIGEIIVLEGAPSKATAGLATSVMRRNRLLHSANGVTIVGRSLASAPVAAALLHAVGTSGGYLVGLFLGRGAVVDGITLVWFAIACWIVAVYFSIVRFVNYLDVRIRSEGWDVHLMMLAATQARTSAVST